MATFIQTNELTGTLVPSGAGSIIRDEQWGIDATLSGYIIQNVTITTNRIYDTTQDQKGAVVSELDYDEQQDMSMDVIGGNGAESGELNGIVPGDTAFTWDGKKWKVRSVTYTGSFQDKKRYNITASRFRNWPANT